MMLSHPQMDTIMDFSGEKVNTLVIENQDFFRTFLQDIQSQIEGFPGKAVLSEKGQTLDWSKNGEILDHFLSFHLNRKPLLTKISSAMESAAISEEMYSRTAKLLSEIEKYLDDLAFSINCDVVCGECTVSGLLKAAGVSIREEYENPLEQVLDYMELVREYEREKLFVFVNLRSFFSDTAIESFLQSILDHRFFVLLVDSCEKDHLDSERRIVVDKDLCEI